MAETCQQQPGHNVYIRKTIMLSWLDS